MFHNLHLSHPPVVLGEAGLALAMRRLQPWPKCVKDMGQHMCKSSIQILHATAFCNSLEFCLVPCVNNPKLVSAVVPKV